MKFPPAKKGMDQMMASQPKGKKKKKKRGKKSQVGRSATPSLTPGLGKKKIPPVPRAY